ncbi:MAG: GatB/YqeY domain-containing protein [Patescibacteria group bacterium]|nr:GatB/YqeY domain-containing protein [Patescibacteria group bacterium]
MELREQIKVDLKEAMLAREEEKVTTLRLLFASVQNKEKENRYALSKKNPDATSQQLDKESQLSSEELLDIIGGEVKKRREAIEAFKKGGRQEMADKEKRELDILAAYLPAQLSEQEIAVLVTKVITEVGAADIKDMGKVMAQLSQETKGKADGALVSRIVKEQLGL